ncbi:MAG: dihydroneopterin aldolase [Bacteroidales bacterium]|jgi:dihydroneopterin aldolase|nr:dihydroneopterin aldolase [Bacteroidales bacterium]
MVDTGMSKIYLEGMEFYAYHGCHGEEQKFGNQFIVDLEITLDTDAAAQSDRLEDALDYARVYELVQQEMNMRSNLLEHVAGRILDRIFSCFPQIRHAEVKVSKLHPPMGGFVRCAAVSQQRIK